MSCETVNSTNFKNASITNSSNGGYNSYYDLTGLSPGVYTVETIWHGGGHNCVISVGSSGKYTGGGVYDIPSSAFDDGSSIEMFITPGADPNNDGLDSVTIGSPCVVANPTPTPSTPPDDGDGGAPIRIDP
jgi:hypothetical protein